MNANELSEKTLTRYLDEFLTDLGLTLIEGGKEVRVGKYRLDAIATSADGSIVIIELKVEMSMKVLHQLLVYPQAVRNLFKEANASPRRVKSLLITTYLDKNVATLLQSTFPNGDISVKVCVGDTAEKLRLVDPSEAGDDQVWDQSKSGPCDLRVVNNQLIAR